MRDRVIHIFQHHRWLRHCLFWAVSVTFLTWYFAVGPFISWIDLLYAGLLHLSLVPVVYLNLRIFIPRLLERNWYLRYLLAVAASLLVGYGIHELTFEVLVPQLKTVSLFLVSFAEWQILATLFASHWILSTLLHLSGSWWTSQQLERENLQLSLQSLQAQVNPHFLFNSLHSLYALSLQQSPRTPELLLSLSEMLRYMLYHSQANRVPLAQELEYLNHLVAFQRVRADDHVTIHWEVVGEPGQLEIAPLLMVPVVENAFKYGIGPGPSDIFIQLRIEHGHLQLTTRNQKWPQAEIQSETGGIGLSNVQQRLALQYPNGHQMEVSETDDSFTLNLNLAL